MTTEYAAEQRAMHEEREHEDEHLVDMTDESVAVSAASAAEPGVDAQQLALELEQVRTQFEQARDQLLRARAEIENVTRRKAKELENAHKFALENFVRELLQVRDSLELGKSAAWEPETDVTKLREGTELTLKLLSDVMAKFGVERLDPLNEVFDPNYHQAMSTQPRTDIEPNTVVNVVQCGYTLNGRLVRPALVMVSQALPDA